MHTRPFRAPHHTSSITALVGGGQEPMPGEISLAHRGVLFLDELPEFPKNAIEALRQPMESGAIRIARTKTNVSFPAKFMLVAAMNPCPCGYYGDAETPCRCTAYEVMQYQKRISGPLLDRIDLQVRIGRVAIEDLRREHPDMHAEHISTDLPKDDTPVREHIEHARAIQRKRFSSSSPDAPQSDRTNAEMIVRETDWFAVLDRDASAFLKTIRDSHLSPRAYYRMIKVARTIADLDQKEKISAEHLAEAFGYRLKDSF